MFKFVYKHSKRTFYLFIDKQLFFKYKIKFKASRFVIAWIFTYFFLLKYFSFFGFVQEGRYVDKSCLFIKKVYFK